MPAPVPVPIRRSIVRMTDRGFGVSAIAARLGLSARTVRHLVARFRARGEAGLQPSYSIVPGNAFSEAVKREIVALRREHPGWGAGYLRVIWVQSHPRKPAPSTRTIRRWVQSERAPASVVPRQQESGRASKVHEVWQMDAADQMTLADGRAGASWLRMADEKSGAVLGTVVFPPQVLAASLGAGRKVRDRRPV